jgi:hypothetical protein
MKSSLFVLCVLLALVSNALTTNLTHKQCKRACQQDHNAHVGGRVATANDKGEYGFDNPDVDCTCIYPMIIVQNQEKCDQYCNIQPYVDKYCHFAGSMCILHVGLSY